MNKTLLFALPLASFALALSSCGASWGDVINRSFHELTKGGEASVEESSDDGLDWGDDSSEETPIATSEETPIATSEETPIATSEEESAATTEEETVVSSEEEDVTTLEEESSEPVDSSEEESSTFTLYFKDASWWNKDAASTCIDINGTGATKMDYVSFDSENVINIWSYEVPKDAKVTFNRYDGNGTEYWGAYSVEVDLATRGSHNMYDISGSSEAWGVGISGVWADYAS